MLYMFLAPFLGAFLLALLQLGWYSLLKKTGRIKEIPFFGIMLFRGLIGVIAIAAILAITFHYTGGRPA